MSRNHARSRRPDKTCPYHKEQNKQSLYQIRTPRLSTVATGVSSKPLRDQLKLDHTASSARSGTTNKLTSRTLASSHQNVLLAQTGRSFLVINA